MRAWTLQQMRAPGLPPRKIAVLLLLLFMGAGPATNAAPAGRYDNLPLRTAPTGAGPATQRSSAGSASSIDGFDTRRVALSLAGVISLILILKMVARKVFPQAGSGNASSATRVLSRTLIAPKQQVILLQVGKRIVVVGDCGTQLNALTEISDPDEVASLVGQIELDKSSASISRKFGGLFQRASKPFEDETWNSTAAVSDMPAPPHEATSGDLVGLSEKIRLLSSQFRRGAS
jgi:flagellar biogenesis protein FliO